jgi:hypothetical protein
MRQPDEDVRGAPQSLAPIQIEGARDDQDIAQLRGRRGLRFGLGFVVLVALIAGGAQLLKSMDAHQAYARAAEGLERVDVEQREAFMRCALPNVQRSQLAATNGLHGALESATERAGKAYGKTLAKCTPLLESFQQAVHKIEAPADLKPQVAAVSDAADDFGKAWLSYKDFLQRSAGPYDSAQTAPWIDNIETAWDSYTSARTRAKDALTARL